MGTQKRLEFYSGFDQRYRVAFPIANAVIYDYIATLHNGGDFYHRESPGITQYNLMLFPVSSPTEVRVSVMQLTPDNTALRVRPFLQSGEVFDGVAERPELKESLKSFYFCIQEILLQTMRFEHPELTISELRGITPPRPTRDKGLPAIVAWKDKHLRETPDAVFAEEIGVQTQSLVNARRQLSTAKVSRGRIRTK